MFGVLKGPSRDGKEKNNARWFIFSPRITLVHTDPGRRSDFLDSWVPGMEPCILHVFQWMMVEHKAMNIWHFALHLLICWTAWGWWTFGWVQRVLQLDTRLHRWYVYIYIYIRHVNCVPICCFSSVNYHAEVRWIIRAHLRPGPQKFNTDTKKWPLFISYPSLFSGGVVCSYFSIGLAL